MGIYVLLFILLCITILVRTSRKRGFRRLNEVKPVRKITPQEEEALYLRDLRKELNNLQFHLKELKAKINEKGLHSGSEESKGE